MSAYTASFARLRPIMSRPVVTVLAALSLFLLVFTLVPAKPGLPTSLKADEPAYYLMAWSLAVDHDLRCDLQDVDRLFREFPLSATRNLVLMSDDGWHTAHFGKPFLYPLFAAPFVALFGGNGMLFGNMLLTLLMAWLGTAWLVERGEEGWAAACFAVGFFLLSASFVYIFWLQPEVFNMAAICTALFLGLSRRQHPWLLRFGPLLSGLALALAAYNKPVLAAVGLPVLWRLFRERGWRGTVPLARWLARWAGTAGGGLGGPHRPSHRVSRGDANGRRNRAAWRPPICAGTGSSASGDDARRTAAGGGANLPAVPAPPPPAAAAGPATRGGGFSGCPTPSGARCGRTF